MINPVMIVWVDHDLFMLYFETVILAISKNLYEEI